MKSCRVIHQYPGYKFTLIELLIVVAILGILGSISLPALSQARAAGIKTQCASNLRQCVMALIMYGDTNNGWVALYGPDYTGWFRQPGMPEKLGFVMPKEPRRPSSYRPLTLCPAGSYEDVEWHGNIAYGAPRFALSPEDYAAYKCEEVINTTEEYLRLNAIPAISNYVILADSAYTKFEKRSEVMPGVQCTHFYRRDEGKASPIAAAICERHNGTANLAYADAHVGDSADKSSILANSKIGAYVDAAGEELTYLEVNTNE